MDRVGFRAALEETGYTEEQVSDWLSAVEGFEAFLEQPSGEARTLEEATGEDVHKFAAKLIAEKRNTRTAFVGLYRYATHVKNHRMTVGVLDLLDGFEILGNLHVRIAEEFGGETRDRIFEGVDLPVLGTPPLEWVRTTAAVMPRLEAATDRATVEKILGSGLRDLSDERYGETKKRFEASESIDAFLDDRGERHLQALRKHRDEGTLYFNQPITDEVLGFVRSHPEIGRGVREGNTIIEIKIPHMTVEYLAATDDRMKRYYVCHCPCVKESLRLDDLSVSPTFCSFCPSFNKKPWEVIYGQPLEAEVIESALRGGLWCKFAIHLPPSG